MNMTSRLGYIPVLCWGSLLQKSVKNLTVYNALPVCSVLTSWLFNGPKHISLSFTFRETHHLCELFLAGFLVKGKSWYSFWVSEHMQSTELYEISCQVVGHISPIF